jgi:hypothetical protein
MQDVEGGSDNSEVPNARGRKGGEEKNRNDGVEHMKFLWRMLKIFRMNGCWC